MLGVYVCDRERAEGGQHGGSLLEMKMRIWQKCQMGQFPNLERHPSLFCSLWLSCSLFVFLSQISFPIPIPHVFQSFLNSLFSLFHFLFHHPLGFSRSSHAVCLSPPCSCTRNPNDHTVTLQWTMQGCWSITPWMECLITTALKLNLQHTTAVTCNLMCHFPEMWLQITVMWTMTAMIGPYNWLGQG